MLGTDGVFDRGTRTSKKHLAQLMEAVGRRGSAGLSICPAKDDKLLVWVKRAA